MAMLKKYCKLNWDDLAFNGFVLAAAFLLVHIITLIAMFFTHDSHTILLSGILLPILGGFILLITALCALIINHDLNLSFGCTRRQSVYFMFGHLLADSAIYLALCWGLTALERTLFPFLWTALFGFDRFCILEGDALLSPQTGSVLLISDFSLEWWYPPLILLGTLMAGITVGTFIRRFGSKGGWVIWAAFMLFIFFGSDVSASAWLPAALAVGAVLLLLAFLWAVYELLHSPIHL